MAILVSEHRISAETIRAHDRKTAEYIRDEVTERKATAKAWQLLAEVMYEPLENGTPLGEMYLIVEGQDKGLVNNIFRNCIAQASAHRQGYGHPDAYSIEPVDYENTSQYESYDLHRSGHEREHLWAVRKGLDAEHSFMTGVSCDYVFCSSDGPGAREIHGINYYFQQILPPA